MMILFAKIYFITFLLLLACKFIYSIFFLYKDIELLETSCLKRKQSVKIFIFMPLLNEGHIFKKIIPCFKAIVDNYENIKFVFVTTSREKPAVAGGKNTIDLVQEFINGLKESELGKYQHIHYPQINITLAQQLNFAIEKISESNRNSLEKVYYGFYNADSNINAKTIESLLCLIEKYPQQKIFQQSSTFLQNHNELHGLSGVLLRANGLRQTRWTFLHEIPRYLKNRIDNFSLVHCVTHGLFVEAKTMKKLGFFPVDSFGEDLYFGFIVRACGYIVKPIPVLENSDTPRTFASMLRQKYVWFWGSLGYFYYWARIKKNMPKVWHTNKRIIIITTILGILDALNWLLSGWAIIIFIFCSYFINQIATAVFFSLAYLWITTFLVGNIYNNYTINIKQKLKFRQLLICTFIYPIVVFIHGLPPIATIIKYFQLIIFPRRYLRPKTEDN